MPREKPFVSGREIFSKKPSRPISQETFPFYGIRNMSNQPHVLTSKDGLQKVTVPGSSRVIIDRQCFLGLMECFKIAGTPLRVYGLNSDKEEV